MGSEFSTAACGVNGGYVANVLFMGRTVWEGTEVHGNMGQAVAEGRQKTFETMKKLFALPDAEGDGK